MIPALLQLTIQGRESDSKRENKEVEINTMMKTKWSVIIRSGGHHCIEWWKTDKGKRRGPDINMITLQERGSTLLCRSFLPKFCVISGVNTKILHDRCAWVHYGQAMRELARCLKNNYLFFCLMTYDDEYLMLSSRRIPSSSMLLTFSSEHIQKLGNQKHYNSLARRWSKTLQRGRYFWVAGGEEKSPVCHRHTKKVY